MHSWQVQERGVRDAFMASAGVRSPCVETTSHILGGLDTTSILLCTLIKSDNIIDTNSDRIQILLSCAE
jgi:hypothetical protein